MTCLNCKKEFSIKIQREAKFCSKNCGQQYRRKNKKGTTKCKCCGKLTSNSVYCGNSCKAKDLNRIYKERSYLVGFNKLVKIIPTIDFTTTDLIGLAKMANIKPRMLYNIVKHETGLTPAQFILNEFGIDIVNIQHKKANMLFTILDEVLGLGEREKSFNSLRNLNGNKLRFDWFHQKSKIAVEYNGPQHYDRRCLYSYNYKKITESTNKKMQFCRDNGYEIIFWPYYKKVDKKNVTNTLISSQA